MNSKTHHKRFASNQVGSDFVNNLIRNLNFEKLEEDSREMDTSEIRLKDTTAKKSHIELESRAKKKYHRASNSTGNAALHANLTLQFARYKKPKKKKSTRTFYQRPMGKFTKLIFNQTDLNTGEAKLKDIRMLEELYNRQYINTSMQAILSLISIFSAIFNYEVSLAYPDALSAAVVSSTFCFIASLMLWLLIIFEYFLESEVAMIVTKIPAWIWRKNTNNILTLTFTLVIFFLHPNPFVVKVITPLWVEAYKTYIYYPLNHIFSLICLNRFWFFFKLYLINSNFSKPRVHRIGRMNGVYLDLSFAFKSIMVEQPYMAYAQILVIFVFITTYGLKLFETPLSYQSGMDFSSYWNSVWCILISILTVGFGDYFPRTLLGRIIASFSFLTGIFLLSMLIATVSNIFSLTSNEKRIGSLIKRIDMFSAKEKTARKVVYKYLQAMHVMRKYRKDGTPISQSDRKKIDQDVKNKKDSLLLGMYYLKESLSDIKKSYPIFSHTDYINYHLSLIETALEELTKIFNGLMSRLDYLNHAFNNKNPIESLQSEVSEKIQNVSMPIEI